MRKTAAGLVWLLAGCTQPVSTDESANVERAPVPALKEATPPAPAVAAPADDAVAENPPVPTAPPPSGFVDLASEHPSIRLDIRYATERNFTGEPLPGYREGAAWLTTEAARALGKVQVDLAADGLGLIVFDAYRPKRATLAMVGWAKRHDRVDLLDDGYIARTSDHARGNTVDLSLVSDGAVVDMGTAWDTFSEASHFSAARGPARVHRGRLRKAMKRRGFRPYAKEWWHFTYVAGERPPARDVPYLAEESSSD